MSLSRLLYIANLLVILSFLLHLRPVSRTGDHVTRVAVSCVAGQFYYQPDTWTLVLAHRWWRVGERGRKSGRDGGREGEGGVVG